MTKNNIDMISYGFLTLVFLIQATSSSVNNASSRIFTIVGGILFILSLVVFRIFTIKSRDEIDKKSLSPSKRKGKN